ncbi:unnamed protein product [Adineta ricciae]|uniref:carbonic anhydrase n=1 Tax=Adineta ricciae TaxID=249248 RepID=A0A815C841_ADIRI|nr:unnamed protein product [Adineta ricciae]CAF1280493.1 unnamed protein product [Adineta ricciae]
MTRVKMVEDNPGAVVIGRGNDRVAINFKSNQLGQVQTGLLSSILIELGDIEIEIRRSKKALETRSKSLNHRLNELGKSKKNGEKSKPSQAHWDYSPLFGPNMWSRIFPELKDRKFQSPIRIYTEQAEYEPILTRHPLIFDADDDCCQTLENTGHTFQVSGTGHTYITGGPVLDEFQFLQFHMHWGANEHEGSEHVIDDVRSVAELHIVTWNTTQFSTPQEAAISDQFDGLLVFAVLLNVVPTDNPMLGQLIELLPQIAHKGEKITLDSNVVSLRNFMPKNMEDYYTYSGSLTTPMCYESVRWIIYRERMSISRKQLNQLRKLKHTCASDKAVNGYIKKNFRPLMPINGRRIFRSFR